MYAVSMGHFDMAKLLIDHGANVNLQNSLGESPLFYAATILIMNGQTEDAVKLYASMVELLLSNGANINLTTMVIQMY